MRGDSCCVGDEVWTLYLAGVTAAPQVKCGSEEQRLHQVVHLPGFNYLVLSHSLHESMRVYSKLSNGTEVLG